MMKQVTGFRLPAIGLAAIALLAGCGGGGGGSGSGGSGGAVQTIAFDFPGGATVAVPPAVATSELKATASSGGPITFTSNTPTVCTVSGSTVSLLIAGECSVTATQPGYQGYAAASQSQLFVVPKRPQLFVKFSNPGWMPVGGAPVPLSATVNSGLPLTFTSKTPTVCSVSGTTMTPLADGVCTVTAAQAGTDIFAPVTLDRSMPIGTQKPALLNFLTGYKDGSTTNEGLIGHQGNQYWCEDCSSQASSDGSILTFDVSWGAAPQPGNWDYNAAAFVLFAPGLAETDLYSPNGWYRGGVQAAAFSTPGTVGKGLQIDVQAAMHFKFEQNPEWFSSTNNKFIVELMLAHFDPDKKDANGNICNVTVKATVQPGAAAATDYSLSLRDQFVMGETCGHDGLDALDELQFSPVVGIKFSAVKPNSDIANASGQYQNQFKLIGPIYFQ